MSTAAHGCAGAAGALHGRAHVTDSRFHGHMYATDASRRIFCDVCRLQRWLDVEAALAQSQADLGAMTHEVADAISAAARVDLLDLDWVAAEIRRTHHSLVALIRALQGACAGEAGQFVHYGATTQDIQDTGQALEMRDVLAEVDRELDAILPPLVGVARAHATTVMTGRTHGQPALPITFGLKVAGWIDELVRAHARIEEMRPRILVAQLFGGVGSMAAFGDGARELLRRFAERLDLGVPLVAWHAARDRVAEYVSTLAMLAASAGRIADEIRTLSRPELRELELQWHDGKVGSTTMPHKRNPEDCQQVVVLARLAGAQVPVALQAMVVEHERDSRELRTEWATVADVSHFTLTALSILRGVLARVAVDAAAMARNAQAAAEDLGTERLMLRVGERVGKQAAYDLIYAIAQSARDGGPPLRDALLSDATASECLTPEDIDAALDPRRSVGAAPQLVADVVHAAERHIAARRATARP